MGTGKSGSLGPNFEHLEKQHEVLMNLRLIMDLSVGCLEYVFAINICLFDSQCKLKLKSA